MRYAALLRGIAPSFPNMSNAHLRGVFEGLGFTAVASVLSSGNILFSTDAADVPALEARIQRALQDELGIPGGTIVRSHPELRALVDSDPFPGLEHGRGSYLTATFLKDSATGPVRLPEPEPWARIVRFDPGARAFLAMMQTTEPNRAPRFMARLDRTYGKDITTRSWLTVQRIVRRMES